MASGGAGGGFRPYPKQEKSDDVGWSTLAPPPRGLRPLQGFFPTAIGGLPARKDYNKILETAKLKGDAIISQGATARVYSIRIDDEDYIVKKIAPSHIGKFVSEVENLKFLKETSAKNYIVTYLADKYDGNYGYILFPFEPGMTLNNWLAEGTHSSDEKAAMEAQVRAALGEIHKNGVIHGDVKANNIWVRTDGSPFILDFGESGSPGDPVTIARSGFGVSRDINADKLSPDFNFKQLNAVFSSIPLIKKEGGYRKNSRSRSKKHRKTKRTIKRARRRHHQK